MDLIFFGIMLFAIYLIVTTAAPPPASKVQNGKVIKVVVVKNCPPHQWTYVDMVDDKGVKHGEQLVCKLCGPIASQSGRD